MSGVGEECHANVSSTSANSEASGDANKLEQLLTDFGRDYANYFRVDSTAEKSALEEELEDLLTRLDEFSSLVDMARSDDALCLNTTLPEIYIKSKEMESLYERIDKLEHVVGIIKRNLDVFEEKVTEAETVLGGSSVRKLLTTLQKPLFSKKPETKKLPKFEPPPIFSTEELFMKPKDAEAENQCEQEQQQQVSSPMSASSEEIK